VCSSDLAAYNAGGGSVRKWGKNNKAIDEWVEEIPFPETNEYVRKVLGNYALYRAFETKTSGSGQAGKEARKRARRRQREMRAKR
jgi:soluble lytic murein transglycosylase